jgi:hypothetical protein
MALLRLFMSDGIPFLPPVEQLPEAVQVLRDDRERAFVWAYMWNGGNGTRAARTAGYSDKGGGAKVRAHHLLQRQDILDALSEMGPRYLYSLQPKALVRLGKLLSSKNERVAVKAVDMTLSRTGMSERTALDVKVSGSVEVDHTSAAVADLRRLKALGVPRAELERVFGFSGLSRYEKLLAIADARPVIEVDYTEVPSDG